jgi:phosphoglycolate phosphatase
MPVIIFDLDGTLIDSKKDIALSLNYALETEGFSPLPEERIFQLVGWGARQLVEEAIGNPSQEVLHRVYQQFWNYYIEHLLDHTVLYPGVADFLDHFQHCKKGVVTNKPELLSKKIVDGLGIQHHFQWLIGGDTLPIQKPNPLVFKSIQNAIEKGEQAVMVGDSAVDIECGKGAGFLTGGVTYGFRPKSELIDAKPDFLIDRFEEIYDLPIFTMSS